MVRSSFILAGFEAFGRIVNNFILGKKPQRWNQNFTYTDLSHYFDSTISGFLHSYGEDYAIRKNLKTYGKSQMKMIKRFTDTGLFKNTNLYLDSGGYQISTGKLNRYYSEALLDNYYDFVVEANELFDRTFILDVSPGQNCVMFENFDDVYEKNLRSYNEAASLPDDVRKKMIYVHHFRTPKLSEIYNRLLIENDFYQKFDHFACGGIVSNMASDLKIPCLVYIIPLITLLKETKRAKRNYLNFHVLGGASYRDVLFYELFKEVVRRYHNIELNITYDSSGVFRQIFVARYIHAIDNLGNIRKMNIKSDNLDRKFYQGVSIREVLNQNLNNMARQYNFKEIDIMNGIYDDKTMHEDVKVYTMLYIFSLYAELTTNFKKWAVDVLDVYESGDQERFTDSCLEQTKRAAQGRYSSKVRYKTYSIGRSIEMLKDLDEDRCDHYITKYLAPDEFTYLDKTCQLMEI
jgi:hypothetical protein